MALEVTGKLVDVQPIQQISEKFSKREFAIEIVQNTNTGMTFSNYASFQLVNNACSLIDRFQIGQEIRVSFDIRGNKWEKDGQVRYFSNLNAWRIDIPQAQGGYAPQQQFNQQYNQNPPQQNAGGFGSGNAAPNAGGGFDAGGDDGLPF